MALADTTKVDWLWKKLLNIQFSLTTRAYYDEDRTKAAGGLTWVGDILSPAVPIPASPPGTDTDDIDVVTNESMTEVSGSNEKAWEHSGGDNWIEPKFGNPYSTSFKDSADGDIELGDAADWWFDYKSGVFACQDTPTFGTPPKITGYRYQGKTLDQVHYMTEESSDPTTPDTNRWGLYFKSTGPYVIDDAGAASGIITEANVDDTPVNGVTTYPISSNWAYDHEEGSDPHDGVYVEIAGDTMTGDLSIARVADYPELIFHTAHSGPNALQADDVIGFIRFEGLDGDSYEIGSWIRAWATETWSDTQRGCKADISVIAPTTLKELQCVFVPTSATELTLETEGTETNIDLSLLSKGTGDVNVTPASSGDLVLDGLKWPQADGSANEFLITDGAAQTSWGNINDLTNDAAPNGATDYVMTWDADGGPAQHKKVLLDNLPGGGGGDPDQDLWHTISDGVLSCTPDSTTDTLTFTGGSGITTSVDSVTDTVTITGHAESHTLDSHSDVDASGPSNLDVLGYSSGSGNWVNVTSTGTGNVARADSPVFTTNITTPTVLTPAVQGTGSILHIDANSAGTATIRLENLGAGDVDIQALGDFIITDDLFAPSVYGGSTSGADITIGSTSHATKGDVQVGISGDTVIIGADADDIVIGVSGTAKAVYPDGDNEIDLGKTTNEWKDVFVNGTVRTDALRIDEGGVESVSTGTGTVKMSAAASANSDAWIPIDYNGTVYYVPGWTSHSA